MKKDLQEKIQDTFIMRKITKPLESVTAGNINSTYRVEAEGANYILQRINKNVFTNPEEVMQNIRRVSRWLEKKVTLEPNSNPKREVLHPINTLDGSRFYIDDDGEYWRMYRWIEGAKTYDSIEEAQKNDNIDGKVIFKKVGTAFGKFQKRLADYPTQDPKLALHAAIPDFHNTLKRFKDFNNAIEEDKVGRLKAIENDVNHPLNRAIIRIREYEKELLEWEKELKELPIRVVHGDPKINNIMIDEKTGEPICIIDLDTVGKDTLLVDYGDAIRSGANPAGEEPENITDAKLDLKLFEAYTEGYLEETLVVKEDGKINNDYKLGITKNEVKMLHKAPKILALELAMRFITDYLNGDEYFKLKEGQPKDFNLTRGLVQLHLAEDMNSKEKQMKEIVETIVREIRDKKIQLQNKASIGVEPDDDEGLR